MNFKTHFIKEWTVQALRDFFISNNYHEVETPTLVPKVPIEPNLYPLKTHWQHKNLDFYLPTSPESSLKKLISQGIGNCFTISKVFRDLEDTGPTHNLEFSMLEWYEMDKTYLDIATTTQKLVLEIYHSILKKQHKELTNILTYQGTEINLSSPWYFFTLKELFQKFANIDLSKNLTTDEIIKTAKDKGYNIDGVTTWEPLYTQIFINEIESKLPQDKPVFILDYPTQLSPLCLPCPKERPSPELAEELSPEPVEGLSPEPVEGLSPEPVEGLSPEPVEGLSPEPVEGLSPEPVEGFSQRFEFYIGGMEIGNAYSESTDPKVLKKYFECDYLPSCAGIGLGVDRLAMLFADSNNIEDVIYFPTSKFEF